VDVVVAAVIEAGLHVDEGEAGEDAAFHGLANALLDRRDELLRDDTTDDVVVEDEARAALARLDLHEDVTELAAATGLLGVLVFAGDLLGDRLAVRDLGL